MLTTSVASKSGLSTTSCFWRREGTHHPHFGDPAYFAPRLRTYFRKVLSQLLARSTHPARTPLFGSCVEAETGFLATRSFHDPPTHPLIGQSGRARAYAKYVFFVWRSVDTTARARTTLFSPRARARLFYRISPHLTWPHADSSVRSLYGFQRSGVGGFCDNAKFIENGHSAL